MYNNICIVGNLYCTLRGQTRAEILIAQKIKIMKHAKNVIIDVDVVIQNWNKNNPDAKEPLSRKRLAAIIGKSDQTLSDWKTGRCPKLIYQLFQLMELGSCSLNDFILPADGK